MNNDFTPPAGSLDFTLLAAAVDPQRTKDRLTELHQATAEFGKTLEETRRISEQADKDKSEAVQVKADAEAKLKEVEDRLTKAIESEKRTQDMLDSRSAELDSLRRVYDLEVSGFQKGRDEVREELRVREENVKQRENVLAEKENMLSQSMQNHEARVKRLKEAL